MQNISIDVTHALYDKIVRLKQDKSVEQFLSELIFRYSNEKSNRAKIGIIPHEDHEVRSIKDKFELINNDEQLSKFKINKI